MSESLDDLIQRVLDGEATTSERARLEARLAVDAQARARHDELTRVFGLLREARTEDPPAGLRDDVVRAVRGTAPAWRQAPARAGRPVFSWTRFALPIAGLAAALVVFASWQGLNRTVSRDGTSGAMSGEGLASHLRLGRGGDAVVVRAAPADGGFRLTIQSGDAPVTVVLEAADPRTRLRLAEPGAPPAASRVETALPANSRVIAEGTARNVRVGVRVRITLPGGESAAGEIQLHGIRPAP